MQGRGVDPLGPLLGRALLEERLLRDALHEALQHHRPPAGAAEGAVGHAQVVPHEVELGEPGLGEHDLVGVADAHLATIDLEELGVVLGGTHSFTLGRPAAEWEMRHPRLRARGDANRRDVRVGSVDSRHVTARRMRDRRSARHRSRADAATSRRAAVSAPAWSPRPGSVSSRSVAIAAWLRSEVARVSASSSRACTRSSPTTSTQSGSERLPSRTTCCAVSSAARSGAFALRPGERGEEVEVRGGESRGTCPTRSAEQLVARAHPGKLLELADETRVLGLHPADARSSAPTGPTSSTRACMSATQTTRCWRTCSGDTTATRVNRFGSDSTTPIDFSFWSASRTGVREMPSSSARAMSLSRWPGSSLPSKMALRSPGTPSRPR